MLRSLMSPLLLHFEPRRQQQLLGLESEP